MLDTIARTLDFPGLTQERPEKKTYEVEQLLRAYRVLLIIDNFETITDPVLQTWLLQVPEPSKVIVTTRELSRAWWTTWPIQVGKMTEAEAQQLIDERTHVLSLPPVIREPALFEQFLHLTEGNPKAITLSLGLHKYERRPLHQIIADLRSGQGELFDDLFARAWQVIDEAARRIVLVASFFVGGNG